MKINPLTCIDFYKADHRRQYPEGTELVYSNFTPRSTNHAPMLGRDNRIVFFGLQYFVKYFLRECWDEGFFKMPQASVLRKYRNRMDHALGKDLIPLDHIAALHELGYLPIEIRALPEGALVQEKVPVLTIHNTLPEFYWLVNYLESIMSNMLWKSCTSATIARGYKHLMMNYAELTCDNEDHIPFQCHDFSFRGMSGIPDAVMSGAGHLLSFVGTDTVPAIDFLEEYYHAEPAHELVGCSVPATEHSVMCLGGKDDEEGTFRRLITETYPKGIVSIVSDTWDFWNVIATILLKLKDEIMARDGKVVIRPDSGDPVEIICGDKKIAPDYNGDNMGLMRVGAIQALWDIFGGTINSKGFKVLDPHIGIIYGDSITPDRAIDILYQLHVAGFASSNIVFGIGSFTYEYRTRDTYGFAMKATAGIVNGEARDIFKDPMTDYDATKKSAKGYLSVVREDYSYDYRLLCQATPEEMDRSELKTVFRDGEILREWDLRTIRARIDSGDSIIGLQRNTEQYYANRIK